ncbi:MAG: cupin domain-containing protein [Janthinobacterium lividum]
MSDDLQDSAAGALALSRRNFLRNTAAALAATAAAAPLAAAAQQTGQNPVPPNQSLARPEGQQVISPDHHLVNEQQPLPINQMLDEQNLDSIWPPNADKGGVQTFKWSYSLAKKEIDAGGWTRQQTVRDLPVSKTMAGVQMYLIPGGIRELHWHVQAEWAMMISGKARITAVDPVGGKSFVNDVSAGDLWLFPSGSPHSIQGLGPEGAMFLLVFNDGNFNEFSTFLLSEWFRRTPKEVLGKNFGVPASTFDNIPKEKLYIFPAQLPRPLAEEQAQAAQGTGAEHEKYMFRASQMQPNLTHKGGSVKIIDRNNFPVTDIAAAIVTLKPGGLRELHWHTLTDEWQYYVKGKGRMTIYDAADAARTADFQAGDVGYIEVTRPHYIENTGDEDLVFLEVFPGPYYQDISAGEWLAHIPVRLADEHLHLGEDFFKNIKKKELVVVPE